MRKALLPLDRATRKELVAALADKRVPRDVIAAYLGVTVSTVTSVANQNKIMLPLASGRPPKAVARMERSAIRGEAAPGFRCVPPRLLAARRAD